MSRRNAAIVLLGLALALQAATLPRPATDVPIKQTNGQMLHLSQYKGKVVVMAFILTTCSHCQRTTGYLVQLQKELGPKGLQVVESAIEGDAEHQVAGFASRFATPFPVGYSTVMDAIGFMQHPMMRSPSMPLVAFIDRKGMIRAQHEGNEDYFGDNQEANLRKDIEALLKEGAAETGARKAPTGKKGSL